MSDPWAYVAHKDGKFAGVCATSIGKNSLKEFMGEFAADGFTLTPVFNREEYSAFIEKMPAWHGDDVSGASTEGDK